MNPNQPNPIPPPPPAPPAPPSRNQTPQVVNFASISGYIWTRQRWWFVGSVGLLLALAILSRGAVWYLPFVAVVIWYSVAQKTLRQRLIQQYAQLHGYQFTDSLPDYHPLGAIFGRGYGKRIYDIVLGALPGSQQFYLYLYEFTVGSGKSSHTYQSTVISIILLETGPHLYLERKGSSLHSMLSSEVSGGEINAEFKSAKQYQLEGDFDTYYKLYGEAGDEVNLLEVINPATMQGLISIKDYDIELLGNTLNLYRSGEPDSAAELDLTLGVAQELITALAPIMYRMDVAAAAAVPPASPVPPVSPAPPPPPAAI
jgi:hypothetical protein